MNKTQDPIASESRPKINEQRRRLAKGGLAAPIVIGTLLSRPVLGAAPHNCTISGQMSGNVSTHGTPVDCNTLGRSPGYWKENGVPAQTGIVFNTVFADAYSFKQKNPTTVVLAKPGEAGFAANPTLLHVLQSAVGMRPNFNYPALGRAAVACYLNALYGAPGNLPWPDFPLKPSDVVEMFNAVYAGGSYQVNPTTSWNATQVETYFKSLYS
jgi:hypothetical protein